MSSFDVNLADAAQELEEKDVYSHAYKSATDDMALQTQPSTV